MKTITRIFMILFSTIILISNIFMCFSMPVFAKPTLDENGHLHVYNWEDIKDCAVDWVMYMASLTGAIFADRDFAKYVQNKDAWVDHWTEDNVTIGEGGTSVTFSKELMAFIKQCIDEYAKEHEPYYMAYTRSLDDFQQAQNKVIYDTAKNLMEDSPSGIIALSYLYGNRKRLLFVDIGHSFRDNSPVKAYERQIDQVHFYDNDTWGLSTFKAYDLTLNDGESAVNTAEEFKERADHVYDYGYNLNESMGCMFYVTNNPNYSNYPIVNSISSSIYLFSKEIRRIRVFNTYGDFQNYTLGKRSVYYTSKYYNYVPEDLTVSLDDLQKEIDDLSKVIDKLLEQITDDTDESEIEELLRQILEALKNQQSSGGGGGTGNVTVNVDMKETNSWLSKIYNKVSEISGKITTYAGQSMSEVVESIENMKQMLEKYLKEITGDLDDIKGQLEEMSEQEFSDKSGTFLDETAESFSEIGEIAKKKFPLSIPNDLYNLLAVISPKSEEQSTVSLYTTEQAAFNRHALPVYEGNGKLMSIREGSGNGSLGMSETGAPVFNLPIVVTSVGWDYTVTVDMTQFQTVADLSRTMFTLIFVLGIIKLSILVIGLWGDIID